MPQSLSKVLVHLIFSTKHREPLIAPQVCPRLHACIVGVLDNPKSPSPETGGVGDHGHVLLALGRTLSVAEVVEEVKFGWVVLMACGLGWRGVCGSCPYRAGE